MGKLIAKEIRTAFPRRNGKFNLVMTKYAASGRTNGKAVKKNFIDNETFKLVSNDITDTRICIPGVVPYCPL
jgi:hypothetical protein